MNRQDSINKSYKGLAARYDSMLATNNWWSRAFCRIVWGFPDTAVYIKPLLALLPNNFSGKLLDIPVGTGLFTSAKYADMKNADITCVDYSRDMMGIASERFSEAGIANAAFQQGDAGNLDLPDNSFDAVLSMNGFHAFPDKEAAYQELSRVLKPGGIFLGCFYVKGENKRTDWFIRNIYVPRKYFTPPFQTLDDVSERLKSSFSEVKIWSTEAILCFRCVK